MPEFSYLQNEGKKIELSPLKFLKRSNDITPVKFLQMIDLSSKVGGNLAYYKELLSQDLLLESPELPSSNRGNFIAVVLLFFLPQDCRFLRRMTSQQDLFPLKVSMFTPLKLHNFCASSPLGNRSRQKHFVSASYI